jgi:Fic family protein
VDLRRRFKEYFNINHLLRNKDLVICVALAKYGYSQFSVEIIEYCDVPDLLKREQYYLDLIKPDYNILKIAGSLVGFKHTEKTKNKLATILKGNLNSQNQPTAIPVQVLDIETGETTEYSSARKAAEALGMSNSTVIRKLNEKSPQSKPYKNRYIFKLTR